jgi:alpha-mannosidase
VTPAIRGRHQELPKAATSSKYGWSSFWVNAPKVKQRYRRAEHALQTSESLATLGSLMGQAPYPAQEFANAWFLLALNMDRNVLWGAGVDASFEDAHSWDTSDRFAYVEDVARQSSVQAFSALAQPHADSIVLYNPVNWIRQTPCELLLPHGKSLAHVATQVVEDGTTLVTMLPIGPMSLAAAQLVPAAEPPAPTHIIPDTIATKYYDVKLDRSTGALVSLRLKPSGRELLGGPANVVLAEAHSDVHSMPDKAKRQALASSSQFPPQLSLTSGPVATMVESCSAFHGGGRLRRVVRFYHDSPRIDFVTETNDVPPGTILSVEFPLAEPVTEIRRGIPYGFSHGAWAAQNPQLSGITAGIVPAIRYSDYTLERGGGVAILDRGLPGREIVEKNTPILLLHNVCDAYALSWKINDREFNEPSVWMNAQGRQVFEYALWPHDQDWPAARVPQTAWEYNCPVVTAPDMAVTQAQSICETSDNLIIEALRRDGEAIELRMVECLGRAGGASVRVNLPHTDAARADLLGGNPQPLAAGPMYELDVRPQEIVTLRFRTARPVAPVEAIRSFEPLIPEAKRAFMRHAKNPRALGHPPL